MTWLCTLHTLVKLNFSHLKTHRELYTVHPEVCWLLLTSVYYHTDSSSTTSSQSFTSQRNSTYAWRRSVSHYLAPPPPWCSSIPLFPLIVSTSVNANSLLVNPPLVNQPPHLQAQVEEGVNICSCRRPPRQPTDGQQHRGSELEPLARNSGGKGRQKMRRGRRREAVVAVCGGLNKGRSRRRGRRFYRVKWHVLTGLLACFNIIRWGTQRRWRWMIREINNRAGYLIFFGTN